MDCSYFSESDTEFKEDQKNRNCVEKKLIPDELLFKQKKKRPIRKPTNKINSISVRKQMLIDSELNKARLRLFGDKRYKPVSMKHVNKSVSNEPFLAIQKNRLHTFLKTLKEQPEVQRSKKDLDKCVAALNSNTKTHWNLPITILRAIKETILNRKWNNLTHLILVLIKFASYKYKPLIRQVYIYIHCIIYINNVIVMF